MTLPTDRDARNALPVWDGFIAYFPDVPAVVAHVSVLGNKQHNIGPLHWNRSVSTDHLNKVFRHMLDHQQGRTFDTDGTYHLAKAVWRLCAMLQLAIEAQKPEPAPLLDRIACGVPGLPTYEETPTWMATEGAAVPVCAHGRTVCRVCNFGGPSKSPL